MNRQETIDHCVSVMNDWYDGQQTTQAIYDVLNNSDVRGLRQLNSLFTWLLEDSEYSDETKLANFENSLYKLYDSAFAYAAENRGEPARNIWFLMNTFYDRAIEVWDTYKNAEDKVKPAIRDALHYDTLLSLDAESPTFNRVTVAV